MDAAGVLHHVIITSHRASEDILERHHEHVLLLAVREMGYGLTNVAK